MDWGKQGSTSMLSPSPVVFFNHCLFISNSAAEATELVDMDILSHALHTDSTLSLEQASTKLLLQDWTAEAAFVKRPQ